MIEAKIFYLWQMSHLKAHFGEVLAMQAMHGITKPESESVITGSAENLASATITVHHLAYHREQVYVMKRSRPRRETDTKILR